jgi:uncharacterized cupredoxin-like copper-binding protein
MSLPRFLPAVLGLLLSFALTGRGAEDEPIEMKAIAGLRFDPPRFQVKPGAKVQVRVENTDDMAHNFVIVAPGARMEVVNAAMTLPITPEQTFIPPGDKILFHTPVLIPGKSALLEFTAPAEGVYPFICTYPGHGMVMFGAMYVGKQEMPALAADENLPDLVRDQAKNPNPHAYPSEAPMWYRTFMRDSGPASIAVMLPGGQNYCWDAGACRLRYVWRGAFVNPMPHWQGNGDAFTEIRGTIYYRARAGFPLRFAEAKKVPADVKFLGFRVVEKLPEFHYRVNGVDVRELIKAAHHGGIETTFTITGNKSAVYFVTDPADGVEVKSEAGKFSDGVMKLTAEKAKSFTVSFTEIVGKEPIGYWSMNDSLADKKPLPVEGVKGRAVVFDGKKSQYPTDVKGEALAQGATFAIWAQLTHPETPEQAYIGALDKDGEFALGANLAGVPGFGVLVKNANQVSKIVAVLPEKADGAWHHLAATLDAKGLRFYFDGKPSGMAATAKLPADAEFFLGSSGQTHFAGATLDEARIYARVLDANEIAALYINDRIKPPPKPPAAPPPKAAVTPAPKPTATPAPTKPAKKAP